MVIFPYKPRVGQETILNSIAEGIKKSRHLVLESGTGTGKTVTSLYGVLKHLKKDQKLLFLTRTNSQQQQVITEMREISPDGKVMIMGIQGRNALCPLMKIREKEVSGGKPDELSRWCSELKKRSNKGEEGCPFFDGLQEIDIDEFARIAREERPTVSEWKGLMEERGVCPYESAKIVLKHAEGIVAPYIFFFNPRIRKSFLNWIDKTPEDLVIIIDEAHNLPDYLRELSSESLSQFSLSRAITEASEYRNPGLSGELKATKFLQGLEDILGGLVDEFVVDEDGFLPPDQLREDLMSHFSAGSKTLSNIAIDLINIGDGIREDRAKKGKLPRSYLFSTGGFLNFWENADPNEYLKLAHLKSEGTLEAYCLDPSHFASVLIDVQF